MKVILYYLAKQQTIPQNNPVSGITGAFSRFSETLVYVRIRRVSCKVGVKGAKR